MVSKGEIQVWILNANGDCLPPDKPIFIVVSSSVSVYGFEIRTQDALTQYSHRGNTAETRGRFAITRLEDACHRRGVSVNRRAGSSVRSA